MLKTLAALAAALAASALVVPTAGLAQETESVRVSYADLNLATDLGQSVLERRIGRAAQAVCGVADNRVLKEWAFMKDCRNGAIAGAQPAFQAAVAAAKRHPSVTVAEAEPLTVTRS
jgi:UrcA family protein